MIKVHTSFVGNTGYNAHSREFFTALSKLTDLKIRNFTVGDSWNGLSKDPHKGEKNLSAYQRHLICEQTLMDDGKLWEYELSKIESKIDIHLVLNETNHHYFYQFDKYGNDFKIAYNVWESTRQPVKFWNTLLKYDQLWVPSQWQKQCSIEQGFPADKVFVVPEAVDEKVFHPDVFDSNIKNYNDNRFKFIVFGRWDYRKATTELIQTFLKTFSKDEPVDLILSVDNPFSIDGLSSTEERLKHYGLEDDRIKILHFLDRKDYIKYLKNGHVYLSCARSEGWGLPLCEALACGTPSIYSDWGAQLEFAKDKGHPVKIIGEKTASDGDKLSYGGGAPSADGSYGIKANDILPGNYAEPDFDDLSKVMRDVYVNYFEYKEKALKDSEILRNEFTWENAAQKAFDIINNISPEKIKIEEEKKPKFSVVTPFYNTEQYVDETIQSVIDQSCTDWEMIVTDDFSEDGTLNKILEWTKKDKRIKFIQQSYKREIYWNPHKYANGEFIVSLDSDDILLPSALETLAQTFVNNPDIVLIHANSNHYNENFKNESFIRPRYNKMYKYFKNFLDYHKYYINYDNYRFGETWGGLRSFRNILPKDYQFEKDMNLTLGKHDDLLEILKFEELGKILYLGRVIHNVRIRKDSNTAKNRELDFDKIWSNVEYRRKNIILNEPTINRKYDNIWENTYSIYYSSLNNQKDRKNVSIINSEFNENDKERLREIYFDHNIFFDIIKNDIDYYFINSYNLFDIETQINNIEAVSDNAEIVIEIKMCESEPDLVSINNGEFEGKLKDYLTTKYNFKWYTYANSYFYVSLKIKKQKQPIKQNQSIKNVEQNNNVVFITGGDKNYIPALEYCVKSLTEFSKIPVIVYGFDCDITFKYSNMKSRKIDITTEHKFGRDTRLYYAKIYASLDCIKKDPNKIYVWIDGDCLVTKNIDDIKKYKSQLENFPLCMRYKSENLIHWKIINGKKIEKGHGEELGSLLNITKNNNFTVATGFYMFDFRSIWFFNKVIEIQQKLIEIDSSNYIDDMALAEERLFNCLFWKYNLNKFLPITWISKDYNDNNYLPKYQNVLNQNKFDIMYGYDNNNNDNDTINDNEILFFHGQRDQQKIKNMFNDYKKSLNIDKLMIVAHPDDEMIFGGGQLLSESGWKVVVITDGSGDNNDAKIRVKEFENIVKNAGVLEYEILGYPDDLNEIKYNEIEVTERLRKIISERKYSKIVTHNENGEYGHIIHKSVNRMVKNATENVWCFDLSNIKLDKNIYNNKMRLLNYYQSQVTDLPGFRDYLIYEGIKKC